MNKKHLFSFTITPVQSFISRARKTQDLYAGSTLLSDLIGEALTFLQKEKERGKIELEYIIPKETIESKPNIFTVEVACKDPSELGTNTEDAVWDYMKKEAKKLLPKKDDNTLPINSIEQLKDYIKISWVLKERTNSFAKDFKQMGALLKAVKNAKKVKQFEEQGRKCALDGEYNVKYYRSKNSREYNDKESLKERKYLFEDVLIFPSEAKGETVKLRHLQEGEGLSAISLFKRLYKEDDVSKFPSVAEVALYDTLEKASCFDVAVGECFEFLNIIKRDNYTEYQLFYDENQTKENLESLDTFKESKGRYRDKEEDFKDAYQKLMTEIKSHGLKLSRYYAVVMFDADKMGDLISGKFLQNKEQDLRKFQVKVSELLGKYAEWATKQIKRPIGRVVYAGGDDFLGFFNINHVLPTLQNLREGFDCLVNKELKTWCQSVNISLVQGFDFSFSAGITIAHYKTPLGTVLSQVRKTEKIAKNDGDRNAVAITVMKRSGEYHQTYWKWSYLGKDNEEIKVLPLMQELTTYLAKGEISDRFLRNLWVQFSPLLDEDGQFYKANDLYIEENDDRRDELIEMVKLELTRQMLRGKKDIEKSTIKSLAENLILPYQIEIQKRQEQRKKNKEENNTIELADMSLTNFLEMLNTCTFICKYMNPE